MSPGNDQRACLERLQRELEELTANLPAHSVPPAMLIRLEDLETEIADLQATVNARPDPPSE